MISRAVGFYMELILLHFQVTFKTSKRCLSIVFCTAFPRAEFILFDFELVSPHYQ